MSVVEKMLAQRSTEGGSTRSVVIACTLRSGSNLLCELLERQGFGRPTEFFQVQRYQNVESRRMGDRDGLPTIDDMYLRFLESQDAMPWRGVKFSWAQFNTFTKTIETSARPTLDDWLPQPLWILLTRRDLAAQAVSLYLADRTGIWFHGDQGRVADQVIYDFDGIWTCFRQLAAEQCEWAAFFAATGLRYTALAYEDLVGGAGLAAIEEELGARLAWQDGATEATLRNQPLASRQSADFAERFRADLRVGRSGEQNIEGVLEKLIQKSRGQQHLSQLARFADFESGFPTIRKIDLRRELTVKGPHAWFEGGQFLDGYALRLDAGSSATLTIDARRLMVECAAHPWSGACQLTAGGVNEVVDLYHWHSVGRTWTYDAERTAPTLLRIAPTGGKSAMAAGTEVWIQQIWSAAN